MNSSNTWEHPYKNGDKTEPVQSFEAFKIWLEMGNKRSLKAVAERVEKSPDTIKKYSCTWKWSERLQDKLSYENQKIHAKQLEAVMTSLDLDSSRDILLQEALGSILFNIDYYAACNLDKFKTVKMKTKEISEVTTSCSLDIMERLINMYCKLEKVHTQNQEKFISMNADCLKIHEFDNQKNYKKVLANGRKQHYDIKDGLREKHMEFTEKHPDNPFNVAGDLFLATPFYEPLEDYFTRKSKEELEEPKTKEVTSNK